jgi:hypothetical protein
MIQKHTMWYVQQKEHELYQSDSTYLICESLF